MKIDQNLPNKNLHSNKSSVKSLPNSSNYSRNQLPYNSNYRGRSPDQINSRNLIGKNSLNSTLMQQENLNGTRNLTQ